MIGLTQETELCHSFARDVHKENIRLVLPAVILPSLFHQTTRNRDFGCAGAGCLGREPHPLSGSGPSLETGQVSKTDQFQAFHPLDVDAGDGVSVLVSDDLPRSRLRLENVRSGC
jgi:hypothetical protein